MDMPEPAGVAREIRDYYDRTPEEDRLASGPSQLEALRTRELIGRFGPRPPATVIDVGGAAGPYAIPLAGEGYTVHLIDASPRLVTEARERSRTAARPLASAEVGDARALPFPDRAADVVLLLGPLYHLTSADDRARALAEAARVLVPGGVLFAAGISRWASTMDGLARELFADPRFVAMAERDLRDGQHRNDTGRADYFTTAYFHRPEELTAEVEASGLATDGLFGLEGPGWILPDFADRWADPPGREELIRVARALESEPSIVGASAHLLVVAHKTAPR